MFRIRNVNTGNIGSSRSCEVPHAIVSLQSLLFANKKHCRTPNSATWLIAYAGVTVSATFSLSTAGCTTQGNGLLCAVARQACNPDCVPSPSFPASLFAAAAGDTLPQRVEDLVRDFYTRAPSPFFPMSMCNACVCPCVR